jgi:superkiller protein 3
MTAGTRRGLVLGAVTLLLATTSAARQPDPELAAIDRLVAAGQFDQALARLEPVLARRPSSPEALFPKGVALAGLERWSEAAAVFRRLLELDPSSRPALRNAGIASYHLGRQAEAIAFLRRYLAGGRDDEPARVYLGRALLKRGSFKEAAELLAGATALRRQDGSVDLDLAEALRRSGRQQESVVVLQAIPAEDPAVAFRAGSILFEMEKYAEAIARWRALEDRYPDPIVLRYNLSLAFLRSGKARAAEAILADLVRGCARDADVFGLLAEIYRVSGRVREAYQAIEAAIAVDPGRKERYVDLLALCLELESYQEGLAVADAALARHPGSAELHAERGALYLLRSQFKLAERDFRRALELDSASPGFAVGLAIALVSDDRLTEARDLLARLQTKSLGFLPRYLYADVLIRLGVVPGSPEEKKALTALAAAVAENPDHAESRLARARLLRARGETGPAAAELERALASDARCRACYSELSRSARARANAAAADRLTEAMEKLGRAEEQESWQRALLRQQLGHAARAPAEHPAQP